jgi:hypothetical protein
MTEHSFHPLSLLRTDCLLLLLLLLLQRHTTGFSHHSTAAWQMHNTNNSNSNTAQHHHHGNSAHYHSTTKGNLHTDAATAAATATAAANGSQLLYPTDSSVRIPVKVEQLPGCIQQLQAQGDSSTSSVSASSNSVWGGAGLQLLMKLPWNMEVCLLELVLDFYVRGFNIFNTPLSPFHIV